MKGFLFVLLFLIPSLAWGQTAIKVWCPNTVNWIPPQADADGTAYTTERYPRETKASSLTIMSAASITNTSTVSSTTYTTGALQLYKSLRVFATGAPTGTNSWTLKFRGSFDGVTFGTILEHVPGAGTVPTDTLKIIGGAAVASPGVWFTLATRSGVLLTFPYIIVDFINTGGGGTITATMELGGRQY